MINSKIRTDFPIFTQHKDLIYLDNAATTHKPATVIKAVEEFYSMHNAPIYRGIYKQAEHATQLYEKARLTIADFINAQQHEIVFTKGTTESINLIACALEDYFNPGDEIILSEMEHHANLVPWQQLAHKKNLILSFIPADSQGTLDLKNLDTLISLKTKLVAITHCSNIIGVTTDITPVLKRARTVGALTLLDAAQSAPRKKIDVKELDADFLVFSGHKMVGPTGIGVLYAHSRVHTLLKPYQTGGAMVSDVEYTSASFRAYPYLYEAGTPPAASALGLAQALKYLSKNIDFELLAKHEAVLCAALIAGLNTIPGISIIGNQSLIAQSGHLVSFNLAGWHPHDLAAYLDTHNIAVRAGHHCVQPFHKKIGLTGSVRISFYFYNTLEEVDLVITALQKLA